MDGTGDDLPEGFVAPREGRPPVKVDQWYSRQARPGNVPDARQTAPPRDVAESTPTPACGGPFDAGIHTSIRSNMALDFAATYKVLVLGDSNVGKTCIVHRYCDERYYDTYISTIGIDFKQKIINLDGTPIKLQIWDTAGQERFRTLTTAYYRGAMGILLMYDVTSLDSFNHLSYWLRNIQENASPDVVKVLAGNKCDATMHRAVDAERGEKIAENFDMPFFEVSCKQNINIEEAFLTLARRIREQRERRASLFDNAEKSEGSEVDLTKAKLSPGAESWRCSC